MKVKFDIFSVITLIAMVQHVFFAVVIYFNKKGNHKANIKLSLLLLCFAYSISFGVLIPTNLYYYYPHLLRTGIPFTFLFGPLIYFYIKDLVAEKHSNKFPDYLHYIPFFLCLIALLPFFLKSSEYKINEVFEFVNNKEPVGLLDFLLFTLSQIHMWVYLIIGWKIVKRHQKRIKLSFSTIDKISLSWISNLIIICVVCYILFIVITIFLLIGAFGMVTMLFIPVIAFFMIFWMGFRGLIQPEIFANKALLFSDDIGDSSGKYEKSNLTDEASKSYYNKILYLMNEEKVFKDPELMISDIANNLSINRTYLSQVINENYGKNFFDFVNSYRVEEIKKYMLDPERNDSNLLSLAYEAGFNSKATFNNVFKKVTGKTPSEFRKDIV